MKNYWADDETVWKPWHFKAKEIASWILFVFAIFSLVVTFAFASIFLICFSPGIGIMFFLTRNKSAPYKIRWSIREYPCTACKFDRSTQWKFRSDGTRAMDDCAQKAYWLSLDKENAYCPHFVRGKKS